MITPLDIVAAARRIAPHLDPTPLRQSTWLSQRVGGRVCLKLESVNLTNSFKIRGAFNAALRLIEDARRERREVPAVVTASAGNHGCALALVSERLGLTTTVFTPQPAPETKKAAIRAHGATLDDHSADYDVAEESARRFARTHGAVFISPYNDADVMAGAGTTAQEVLRALPSFDVLVVPLGGGGLASGMGTLMKAVAPRVRIVGVEAAASTPFAASRRAGAITRIVPQHSLADGLTGNLDADAKTFDIAERVVDELVSVEESEIAEAMAALAAEEHLIAEGAGAVTTAALLSGKAGVKRGETAVAVVTGANIDATLLAATLRARGGKTE